MKISKAEFTRRRKKLMAMMDRHSIAIIPGAREVTRSRDTEYPFRQNSDLFYLTGFEEPDSVLVLVPGRRQGQVVLFCRERDPEMELWNGYRLGPEGAAAYLGDEIDAGHAGAPVFTSMPNPRSLSYYDARIQDAKNLEVQVQPADISAKLAPLVGEGFAKTARALFEEFAANNRKLLADAAMVIRRCRPRPDQLELPQAYDGPCYVVRNHWHPHVTVDDSVEALLADPQVEVLHTASWNGVTISKVRIGK